MTDPVARAARLSVGAAVAVLGLKLAAWWLTGSVTLFADALETIVNVVGAAAALFAIRVGSRPADAGHAFGHGKAEYFSAGFEGGLVLLAGVAILVGAGARFSEPRALVGLDWGLALTVLATVFNGALAGWLLRVGRREQSPALIADARHLRADVVTSLVAVLGLLLAAATGWWRLDPLLALLVGLHVIHEGVDIVRGAFGGLMDEAWPEDERTELEAIVVASLGGALEAHALRTRRAGRQVFVELHLVVPGDMTVHDAHAICDRIEDAVAARWPDARTTVHVEPEHEAEGHGGDSLRPA